MRVQFDFDIDDLVDASVRMTHRSPSARRRVLAWRRGCSAAMGVVAGLIPVHLAAGAGHGRTAGRAGDRRRRGGRPVGGLRHRDEALPARTIPRHVRLRGAVHLHGRADTARGWSSASSTPGTSTNGRTSSRSRRPPARSTSAAARDTWSCATGRSVRTRNATSSSRRPDATTRRTPGSVTACLPDASARFLGHQYYYLIQY